MPFSGNFWADYEFLTNEGRTPFAVLRRRASASQFGRQQPYRFAGEGVRAYADKLREEMERRRLNFTPIDWRSS